MTKHPSGQPPRLVLRFAVYAALALAVAGFAILWFVREHATARAQENAAFHTRFVADAILRERLRKSDFARPVVGTRRAGLDRLFQREVFVGGALRVKLWSPSGTVTYSNDHSLIGTRPDADELPEVLRGETVKEVSTLNNEGGPGRDRKVLEVYTPVTLRGNAKPAGVFELYQDYAPVARDERSTVVPIAGVLGLALLALFIALVPILRRVTKTLEVRNRRLSEQAEALERSLVERESAERALREREAQLHQSQKMEAVGRLAGGIAHDFNNLLTGITGHAQFLRGRLGEGDRLSDELHEITEALRQAQDRLDRIRSADGEAGRVSHDFLNLLTGILGYSDLYRARLAALGSLQADVDEIAGAAERAAALTRQLLVFSRKQVVEPRVLDLNSLVSDMAKMLGRWIGEDVALVLQLAPNLGHVRADPGHLEQVVMNLTVNARDAMPDGGALTIRTANVDVGGPHVMLSVTDTGCGMDADTRAKIFEPFFTTKDPGKGTGLGLSTVYGIVNQSDGRIEVESHPGRGTTFRVYWPEVSAPVDEEPASQEQNGSQPSAGSETILIVEDENLVRNLARRALVEKGYSVVDAETPSAALLLSEQAERPFDLVLSDVVMPEMSGLALVERLRQLRPDVRALFMSGYPDTAVVENGALNGQVPFIQKPFTPDELARKVREVLDGHAAAAATS
jgi:signal transduction histidine kinase/ActR/RegA family two-component response regulator